MRAESMRTSCCFSPLVLPTRSNDVAKHAPDQISNGATFFVRPLDKHGPHLGLDLNRQPLTAGLRIIRHGCSPNFCAKL
jgi:hypothetical protein